ncbi:MAG: N-acetyl-gamma-glutamyl-phosphate reductase [Betaproteobacteria bacterium]|nr:N-acetyl-gamma-glutamyl-phosphate reductase [Betaproteobacteria bacterium]
MNAAVVGASGYAGAELCALLAAHPHVERTAYISRKLSGETAASRLPFLRGRTDAVFLDFSRQALAGCDAVFFATPHAVAMHDAAAALDSGAAVIDLSPDFRLRDAAVFAEWYGAHASPELLSRAVYGLPEAAREKIKTADLIACPGCSATAAELALIPLAAAGMIRGSVIIDAKSGVSGAGRQTGRADLLFAEQAENFKAYAVDGHRHLPEIKQAVAEFGGEIPPPVFVPHLLPAVRGIYATIYAPLKNGSDCAAALREYWKDEIFIDVLEDGVPELAHVARTNRVQISARNFGGDLGIIFVALDNLQKGAAGQAVQNMNIRFGFAEESGLSGARNI